MMNIALSQIASITGGKLIGPDAQIQEIGTDTRKLSSGCLFVALIGENFNGNDYAHQAIEQGASAVLVSVEQNHFTGSQVVVSDTTVAYGQLASWFRTQWGGALVAITGSCGKTTVKGMVASILNQKANTWATQGNLNNHIGVPKTLLSLLPDHEFAVVEMGASGIGEIGYLAKLAKPEVALVNNVVPAHLEGFGSVEAIAETKGEIYGGLSDQGTAIVNLDDRFAGYWLDNIDSKNWIGFSVEGQEADVFARAIQLDNRGCAKFDFHAHFGKFCVQLNVLGRANVANALAAGSCAMALGVEPEAIKKGLESFSAVAGRLAVSTAQKGALLIDDSYNANPGSVKAAIDVLSEVKGRKILVLGDMGELAEESEPAHREIGRYAKNEAIDVLLTVGSLSLYATQEFGEGSFNFESREALITWLEPQLNERTAVLVKGSRSAGMDKVATAIAVDGEKQ